jgi:hypothetical protein
MPSEYLFEFHYQDGRIEPKPSGEFSGWTAFEIDQRIEINGTWWLVRNAVPAPGYSAKIILDED